MAIFLAFILVFLVWLWIYLIYRILCGIFSFYVSKDELDSIVKKRARLWGIFGASLIGAVPYVILEGKLSATAASANDIKDFMTVVFGPLLEEFAKGLAPLAAYFMMARPSGRKLFVIGALSGAGFYLTETFLYSSGAIFTNQDVAKQLVGRAVALCLMHPTAAAFTGLGLGLSATSKSFFGKIFFIPAGFCFASFLHMWNNGVARMIDHGQKLNQSEFFGIHVFLLLIVLILSRIRIYMKAGQK